ncbi:MAG: OmpA family protein [Gemmatimonadota bacterium]|nr:OmpA family protein [Gemmatimonadota bacterium]
MSDHLPSGMTESPHAFDTLRDLLVGPERRDLEDLRRQLEEAGLTTEQIAEHLPEAIALRAARDEKLARSLAPTIEGAIQESVRRRPEKIASAIYPIIGPAIRKSIADTMAGIVTAINQAIEHSLSPQGVRWRIEAWRTGLPYAQIVIRHALLYRVEQVLLVHAETGILLAHAAAPDLETTDADLVSSMMTAIRDFARDSFQSREQGGLRTFQVDEFTILVEQGPRAVLAAKVRGQPPDDLLERMQVTLETVHFEFGDPLKQFDGDAAPFAAALPLLEERLETVVATDRREGTRWGPRVAWGLAGLAVLLLAAWFAWSTWRWRTAVDVLAQEPGIVVLDTDRGLRHSRIAGLRDPAAADAGEVLAQAGIDTRRVEFDWEPFVSLDPRMVVARATARLGTPASITLALAGDTLVATGSAPASWVARAMAATIPGVTAIDARGVTPLFPDAIVRLRRQIEDRQIQFAMGSSALPPEADSPVSGIATAFARLEAEAAELGYRATLRIVGRTDSNGATETNQQLSRDRAEAVGRALTTRGVATEAMEAVGVASSRPIVGGDPAEAGRLNRSVSFEVGLAPTTMTRGGLE